MPLLETLVNAVSKAVSQTAETVEELAKDPQVILAGHEILEKTKEIAEATGILRPSKYGEGLYLKVPFFKSMEDKIEEAFAAKPERSKVCFRIEDNSVRKGVVFYDPEGNPAYEIHANKKNLKGIELFQGTQAVGSIKKIVMVNLNPFVDKKKYDTFIRGKHGIITVHGFTSESDFSPWKMTHQISKDYIIENAKGTEIARFYSLKYFHFVFDYDSSVDPVELILAFMAIKIRLEEEKVNHHNAHKGTFIDEAIADIKDIF